MASRSEEKSTDLIFSLSCFFGYYWGRQVVERCQEDREGRLFPRDKGKPPTDFALAGMLKLTNVVARVGHVGQFPALSRICAEIPLA